VWCAALSLGLGLPTFGRGGDDIADLQAILGREIIGPHQAMAEVQTYIEARIPRMKTYSSAAAWEQEAERLRHEILDRVVFRGKAAEWRKHKVRVEWFDTISGGPGYRIKKLRYEPLPGLWIPAILYEPEKLAGKVPAVLNVNGHDGNGKAAQYKQIRCINQAKRGMLALNLEWIGMGQLRGEGYHHGRMNQLDLCGTSGLAPFYLCLERGLDVLLALPNADPQRVAVTGLSGGGWQTIFISAVDTRVKLTDPVAGYSSFLARARHLKDLGDSEQTPNDLATIADYTHLTAMMAPRPTLLTYNSKDECCFEAGYALPPLLEAARPIFRLYEKEQSLRSHINHDPGTHNYEKDNRQALYRMLGDFFSPKDSHFSAEEIPSNSELKSKEELFVPLPEKNHDFHTLALEGSRDLPHCSEPPSEAAGLKKWRAIERSALRQVVRAKNFKVQAEVQENMDRKGTRVTYWRLKLDGGWSVPVVEMSPKGATKSAVVLNDPGRKSDSITVCRLLKDGYRVFATDLFYFGEARMESHDYLFPLLLASIGERALGLQASQLAAVVRWLRDNRQAGPVTVVAVGPRLGTVALVATAATELTIDHLELHGSLGSLKEVIVQNRSIEQMPEMFCFGLLESFDIKQLEHLANTPVIRIADSPASRPH
jgi:dienelactone hydrolase